MSDDDELYEDEFDDDELDPSDEEIDELDDDDDRDEDKPYVAGPRARVSGTHEMRDRNVNPLNEHDPACESMSVRSKNANDTDASRRNDDLVTC